MKLKYTPQALNDLLELKTYIGKTLHNAGAAKRITKSILDACSRLKEHPQLGMSLEAKTELETDLRYLICEKHLALYRVEDDLILIVRILDGRMDYMRVLFSSDI